MNFISLVVLIFLAVVVVKHFFPKKLKSNKFILEDILKWQEFLSLFTDRTIRRRVLVSLAFLIAIVLGGFILVPGIDNEALNLMLGKSYKLYLTGRTMGIFTLGIMPFISANMWLLLFAIIIPPLRKYSQSAIGSDKFMTRLMYSLTIILCLIQSYEISRWLQNSDNFSGTVIVPSPGLSFTISTIIFITLGTLGLLVIGYAITKYGIGHGISLIILAFTGITFVGKMVQYSEHRLSKAIAILFFAIILFISAFWLLRIKRVVMLENTENRVKTTMSLSVNQAGLIPIILATSIILLLLTLIRFSSNSILNKFNGFFTTGELGYNIVLFVLIIIFSLGYGRVAFNPKYIIKRLKQVGLKVIDENIEKGESAFLCRLSNTLSFIWAGVLIIYFFIPDLLRIFWRLPYNLIQGKTVLVITAVVFGCLQTLRKRYNLKEVYVHPELGEVLVVKSYLETKGLKVFLDNAEAFGRLYCYFIGPLATKKLLVSSEDYLIASQIVEEYKEKIK